MKITTIGLDLAKNAFQLHGIDERGRVVFKKQLKRAQVLPFFANQEPCRIGRHGGLRRGAPLGEAVRATRAHGEAHGPAVRQALRKNQQARRSGCRGDLRGGDPTVDARRSDHAGSWRARLLGQRNRNVAAGGRGQQECADRLGAAGARPPVPTGLRPGSGRCAIEPLIEQPHSTEQRIHSTDCSSNHDVMARQAGPWQAKPDWLKAP